MGLWVISVHHSQACNRQYYIDVLPCLQENICQKCPEIWQNGDWFIHHDSSHCSVFPSVHGENKIAVVPHSPYSLDFAFCYLLFPKMKLKLKGKRFHDVLEIQKEEFQTSFQQ
jgi:hypothetical protein